MNRKLKKKIVKHNWIECSLSLSKSPFAQSFMFHHFQRRELFLTMEHLPMLLSGVDI